MNLILNTYRLCKYIYTGLKYNLIYLIQKNKKLSDIVSDTEEYSLFITHNFGGGTETYEKNYTVSQQNGILTVRAISYKKDLFYKIENLQTSQTFYIKAKDIHTLFQHNYEKIIVNSLVCVYDCLAVLTQLSEYKKNNSTAELIYHVHDFHCICPKFNLIAKDTYCNLECSNHNCVFTLFPDAATENISTWRAAWNLFLISADRIICFSESSMKIILQAYPQLPLKKINVIPHDMSYCRFTPIEGLEKLPLHIGIIGKINSIPKGETIVRELLKKIPADISVTLVGSKWSDFRISRKNIRYLGPYEYTCLQKIIQKEKISSILFPAVCPETFSYLISELMQMKIPIFCFNHGAQAEKIRAYKYGTVLNSYKIEDIIAALTVSHGSHTAKKI